MNNVLLTYHNSRLTPEARWFLMRWATVIGLDQSTKLPLQNLFTHLGLTYAQGRRAWDVLTSKQGDKQELFVEIELLPNNGPGRPASRYCLSAKLVKAIEAIPKPSCEHHAEEIATLAKTTRLSATDKKSDLMDKGRLRRTGLTLPNRWLLMVLLAHVDSPGIVTRLSLSAMHRLTGMSRYRITSQLKKLVDLEIIAHHQSGRYAPKANARKTSIYLLDLAHPLMGNGDSKAVVINLLPSRPDLKQTRITDGIIDAVMTAGVCDLQLKTLLEQYGITDAAKSDTPKDITSSGFQTYEAAIKAFDTANARQAEYDKIKRVMDCAQALLPSICYLEHGTKLLLRSYDEDDADWLLTIVHADAMWLLSTSWVAVEEGQLGPDEPHPDIIAGIAHRLGHIPENVTKEDGGKAYSDTEAALSDKPAGYSPLVILFYALSHHLAKQLQHTLQDYTGQHSDIDYEATSFMLIPVFSDTPDKQRLPMFQLRGYSTHYVEHKLNDSHLTTAVFVDLKSYWRKHYQDCLSTFSDGLGDPTSDSPTPSSK
ncbi:hypothetical protein [Halomonas sp. ATBC28]|uniref:hypothetical protein n=1 Tax=Halomonas sp. ATBC28 TaxID=2545264 RepID=UPI001485D9FB|nr:hypothetical protein [Halomonas sp. ATBC28]